MTIERTFQSTQYVRIIWFHSFGVTPLLKSFWFDWQYMDAFDPSAFIIINLMTKSSWYTQHSGPLDKHSICSAAPRLKCFNLFYSSTVYYTWQKSAMHRQVVDRIKNESSHLHFLTGTSTSLIVLSINDAMSIVDAVGISRQCIETNWTIGWLCWLLSFVRKSWTIDNLHGVNITVEELQRSTWRMTLYKKRLPLNRAVISARLSERRLDLVVCNVEFRRCPRKFRFDI